MGRNWGCRPRNRRCEEWFRFALVSKGLTPLTVAKPRSHVWGSRAFTSAGRGDCDWHCDPGRGGDLLISPCVAEKIKNPKIEITSRSAVSISHALSLAIL